MKLIYRIFLLLLLKSTIVFPQKGIVRYGYIQALTIGSAKGPDSNSYLLFNKDFSYYVTAKDSLEKPNESNEQKVFLNNDKVGGSIYNGTKVSPQGDQVVYDVKKNIINSNLLYRKQIYTTEEATKFNWKIEKESKKIGKFNCKKATTYFRGRNYTAWFTQEIPVSFGPWKLNGLPGLILEAYDTNKYVYWYFKSVEYPSKTKQEPISIRKSTNEKNIVFISITDFKKLQIKEQNRVKETNILLKKNYPEIDVETPKLSFMFVEFE